jgi:DNA-binding winged helix-turn-helix (wHTH) protein/TolB-like protein/Flp pilus assembly protein TadD
MNDKFQNRIYTFGEFQLDTAEHALRHGGEQIPLTHKAVELLILLVEKRGQTLTKNELLDALWRDTYDDEHNLAVTVMMLRKAFGETAFDKKFIETVPKRGYRFVAETEETTADLLIEKQTTTRITIEEKDAPGLKNVWRRPLAQIAVVGVILAGLGIFLAARYFSTNPKPLPPTNAPRTLAVLPLKNLSAEADESLSIGLTDALITRLGNIRGLAVRPTSAVLPFTASGETPQAIGGQLNVETVLESSVQRVGNRLRVSVQLVKTSDGAILWSENFDETEADLFKIQDSISARVADAFRLKNADRQTASRRTEDFEAYRLYLRGRHAWNKRTPEGMRESVQFFRQAIDRDPTFALAFAGLADAYALLSEYNTAPPRESFPQAKAAAEKALEIDSDLAEAHTTLAYALANYDWNFAEAEREYRRAIELNPNYATAHQWYAEFLSAMRRFDEARAEIRRAEELDPLSPIIQSIAGLILYHTRDFDAAIAQYQKTVNNQPNFPIVYAYLSLAYAQKGMYDEAFEAETKLLQAAGVDEKAIQPLRQIYRQTGWKGFLGAMLAGTNAEAQKHYVSAFSQAFLYMRMGEREKALEWLEKAFAERHRYVVYLNADPYAGFLRDDARFQDLISRVGLEK